jgi:hypothetical protein
MRKRRAGASLCARGRWGAAVGMHVVGPRGARSTPLYLEGAGGRSHFPSLLQETAAADFPSKTDGKSDSAVLKETGAGGLKHIHVREIKSL